MAVETILKQPAEVLRQAARFAPGFVAAVLVEARVEARGLVPGAAALTAAASVAGGAAEVELAGGGDGESYLVTVVAEDADGLRAEAELDVMVMDAAWAMPDGGAPYLTIAEFVARFGLAEVIRMTDGAGDGRIDRALLIAALTGAQAIVDAHVAARHVVPLDPVPQIVTKLVGDLARAELYPGGAPDGVGDQAKLALRMLERIQSGAMPLPAATPPAPAVSETPILIAPGRRAYPDGLADY